MSHIGNYYPTHKLIYKWSVIYKPTYSTIQWGRNTRTLIGAICFIVSCPIRKYKFIRLENIPSRWKRLREGCYISKNDR